MSENSEDQAFMRRALEEGRKGLGLTAPNPAVGCVIVNSRGHVIGKGYHAKAGGDHAEIAALKTVTDSADLKGSTVYVTLEPCAAEGKTPSCAHTLAALPIQRVVFGCQDPNPAMAGGQKVLVDAGIQCDQWGPLKRECLELAEVFICNQSAKRSFVHVKVGASLDGQIALKSGESQWITSESSREQVQVLRGQSDAVLVGRGTFEQDNPRLNSRSDQFINKTNIAVIIDPKGGVISQLSESRLLEVRPSEKVFVIVHEGFLGESENCKILRCPEVQGQLDLKVAMQALLAEGVHSVLVEGGGTTISQFFNQGLVDRLTVFMAPKIIGAAGGQSWTKGLSIDGLENAICLPEMKMTQLGSNFCLSSGMFTDTWLKGD